MKKSSFEKNIGIIGLGVLGSAIAKNFIDKNISISGYDINEKVFEGLKSNKIQIHLTKLKPLLFLPRLV